MISTYALSVFILHHHINELGNKNLWSIQYIMHASDPDAKKYKKVCEDFPNLAILTKSATPGEFQLTFSHAAVGNKSLGWSVVGFELVVYISSTSAVSLNIGIAFAADGDKIRLPIAEVLLCAASGDLARSNKQRDWTPRNAVLLPPLFMEAAILHGSRMWEISWRFFLIHHVVGEGRGNRQRRRGQQQRRQRSHRGGRGREYDKNR